MANTVLTPQIILREAYAIMHQKSNYLMRLNRQYDNRFAQQGAKIGQTLDIRLPAKYTTRRGNTMSSQNYVERKVQLPIATIDGIDLNFTQEQLTFSLDDFSERVLKPAVSQLVATVEADAMDQHYKKVANYTGVVTTASTTVFRDFQNGGRYLSDNLAPLSDRTACLNTQTGVDFRDAVKGLFQSADSIREQYVEGIIGRTGGFNCYENTLLPAHTSGTFTTAMAVTISTTTDAGFDGTGNAWPTASSFGLKVDGANPVALKKGDISTIGDLCDVHPETKKSLGYLKRFVVQDDVSAAGGGTFTVPIYPIPIISGAYQNVSGAIQNDKGVTLLGPASGGGAITYGQNLLFHRDYAAFVTADLEDPSQYGAWGAREVMDGLSMRIWRQGDIVNGNFPCRLDICWGTTVIYPEWACRWVHAQS